MPNWFTKTVFSKRWWKKTAETAWSKIENTSFVQWWEKVAWSKIKNNASDLAMMLLFEISVLFTVADPTVFSEEEIARWFTYALALTSIGVSIAADLQHTREKRDTFNKLKMQVTLPTEMQLSKPTESFRWIGLMLSGIGFIGYVICNPVNASFSITLICASFGVLSCHIGRKLYDMGLQRKINVLEELKEERRTKDQEQAKRLRRLYTDCVEVLRLITRIMEEPNIGQSEKLSQVLEKIVGEDGLKEKFGIAEIERIVSIPNADSLAPAQFRSLQENLQKALRAFEKRFGITQLSGTVGSHIQVTRELGGLDGHQSGSTLAVATPNGTVVASGRSIADSDETSLLPNKL